MDLETIPIYELEQLTGLTIYPSSITAVEETLFFLGRAGQGKKLGVICLGQINIEGERYEGAIDGSTVIVDVGPLTSANTAILCKELPWLRPQPLGLQTSAGMGDRLGLASPGHVRAVRQFSSIAPIFAQQSVRENARTGRTPQQVIDDAIWGVFQEGWREPWGADADHLKTTADVDAFVAAGYTFYTIDPGDHVDNEAHTASMEVLKDKIHALPWDKLEDSPEGLHERYLDRRFEVESFSLEFDQARLARAAAKYGRAIAHTAQLARHLAAQTQNFELEMSVDETETPTSVEEHFFIASELKRLGVQWVSLAPRYVGRFEKGVDYIGDLDKFEAELARHAAIARVLGPYKLSIHSGSDKFSVYPIAVRHTRGLVHLKTAGTSYLEALRTIASVEPALFREILALAHTRYAEDRASYHVSANPTRVPAPDALRDEDLATLLDSFDARQMFHVTFGSALERFGARLKAVLAKHEETHYTVLEAHFVKHLTPFGSDR